jgi:hypothetical protein
MATVLLDSSLTIVNTVQGVTEWLVERKVNLGTYATIGTYDCPSAPVDESEVYVFAYQTDISSDDFEIGDIITYRFTPTGYDEGNGDIIESDEYEVIEGNTTSARHYSYSFSYGG